MKNFLRSSFVILASAGFALFANALPITGAISIAGAVSPAGGNINTATSFSSLGPALVTQATGNFATSANIVTFPNSGYTVFSMTPFSYGTSASPSLSPSPVLVYTTTNGGITTSFTLQSITMVDHSISNQIGLLGSGFFSMTGFDNTFGTFNLTANQGGSTFSFSASQQAVGVPDSGSSAMLLGLGIVTLMAGIRRFNKTL